MISEMIMNRFDDFFKLFDEPTATTDPTYLKFTEEGDYYYYA